MNVKWRTIFISVLVFALGLAGCSKRTMDYIMENEPSVAGIVEEAQDSYLIIYIRTKGYPDGASCKVSLEMESEDSYTDISVGDEIVVYYNGEIEESEPLQINSVYGITLKTSVNQDEE